MSSKLTGLSDEISNFVKSASVVACPDGCQSHDQPMVEMITLPSALEKNNQCPSEYEAIQLTKPDELRLVKGESAGCGPKGFSRIFVGHGDFQTCKDQADAWTKKILMGKGDLGSYLDNKKCPSPCSYSVSVEISDLSTSSTECQTRLDLKILCGPPKKENKWVTTATVIDTVSCEVKR